ncbi:hypothetical protein [Bacteroides cellulosilyticus]|nr:hypothetical protein [Bacteroides cellulosilyticus]MBV3639708.1 hypothetical protein [Bacteroides cellulosilyticus]MBV3665738.1 hypothetical protein [Bacteroides cellulosilyticus]MBV3687876.1 hypothetical protein [Bacteroides cellulosilyticus]MBV3696553.1 hypothetical protein [Bacteroides cellulosilyticus]MBV3710119.1 hypothetical protein [Bacteroides cellulosilyticus]
MKGKVFSSSQDLYQDQAKILFDFYKDAAEKIVSQEEELEKEMGELKNSLTMNATGKKKAQTQMYVGLGILVVGLALIAVIGWLSIAIAVAGLYWGMKNYKLFKSSGKSIDDVGVELKELENKHQQIFRDYKIEKMGVVYVPVASQVPFENKSFVIDHTGNSSVQNFELQLVNNQGALSEKLRELDELSTTAPLVEESKGVEEVSTEDYSTSIPKVKFYDYFGRMDRNLRDSAYFLSDLHTVSVGMPVIPPDSPVISYLNEYGTANPSGAPVLNVFDTAAYDKEIEQFNSLNAMRHSLSDQSEQFEDVLRRLISNVGYAVQTIAAAKVKSTNSLVESSNQLLFTILKTSYNHYSPKLEKDELEKIRQTNFNFRDTVENYTPFQLKESSRVRYDMKDHSWVAEDGSRTTMPYGISQIQEEIVAPIVQNLLAETRLNRLDIYNDIDNQKRDYLNQWHRETQDFYGRNRTSGDDLINIMRSNLTKLLAAQSTFERLDRMKSRMLQQMMDGDAQELEENAGDQLENTSRRFAEQSDDFKQIQEEFKEYMKFLQGDINKKAKEYGYIEYFDASLRDGMAKKIVDANDNVALLDDRRRPLASINPFYAFASNMPPAPAVEECVEEYMSLDIARVATDSLQEIAENSQEATLDYHAELVDDSDAMEYSVYAPQHMEEAEKTIRMSPDVEAAKPEMSETSEEAEVPKESETPVVSEVPAASEAPVIPEVPVIPTPSVTPEVPATPEVSDEMDDLSGLDDLDDLSDLDDLDDLSDLEKDK